MRETFYQWLKAADAWLFQERHRQWCANVTSHVQAKFTEHPHEAGETYLQHLWFTARMAARFISVMVVLLIHGIFPFLLIRAASNQVEAMYRIMKSRIPKNRRDAIDLDYSV